MSLRERFNEFWPLFISTHLSPWNRRFHLFGNVLMFSSFAVFALTGRWQALAIGFLGYIPSWIGHFLFEGNVPVTLKSPYLSALSDLKMVGLMAAGELEPELERLFGSKNPSPGTPIRVSPDDERRYQEALRYRVNASIPRYPSRDYWEIFLLKHQNPINITVHALAMVYLYLLIGYSIYSGHWALLVLIPLSQIAGLISHAIFERSHIDFEDAIFSVRAFSCLNRMLYLCLTGRYGRELARLQARLGTA